MAPEGLDGATDVAQPTMGNAHLAASGLPAFEPDWLNPVGIAPTSRSLLLHGALVVGVQAGEPSLVTLRVDDVDWTFRAYLEPGVNAGQTARFLWLDRHRVRVVQGATT